jgi:hypothetical protein
LKGLEIMRLRFSPLLAVGTFALAGSLLAESDARACGGCFGTPSQTVSTVVTGHRMALALSPTHTVLWDQIKYAGSPTEFAWVLPVKPGARVEISTDAWFEALDAATTAQIVSPAVNCPSPSPGCGFSQSFASSDGFSPPSTPPVTVVHQGTVGPYETVTLHANVPDALPLWLGSHGYAIDATVQPVIDSYTKEGFDFIALRLLPGKDVQQMKPVRVVSPGMSPTLPLRMVAAGTGATVDMTLFVIGEGAWVPQNFPHTVVQPQTIVWDFNTSSSTYAVERKNVLAGDGGRTWNEAFAIKGSLLSPLTSPVDGSTITYQIGEVGSSTIAEAYVRQGIANGEGVDSACVNAFASRAESMDQVVNPCPVSEGSGGGGGGGGGGAGGGGSACGEVGATKIDSRQFACGKLDDVAVALEGLHPHDVTITRLEASLPRAALAADLVLEADSSQDDRSNWFLLSSSANAPACPSVAPPILGGGSGGKGPGGRGPWALIVTLLAAVLVTFGRRATRPVLTARAR